ncbi:hypothetical protein GF354_03635 [Candidatus Peregrinibacteria bacterium]|nr:hypothetical protein [Candidatus Peregrinibacteria bacterium]
MKYNWSIIGHENQLNKLEKDIETGNLAHSYLMAGPNSVGKYTVAKKLAGILQCENNFCHKCPTCIQIRKGSHIDTMEFKDDKKSIGIADVKSIIERLHMTPQAPYKVLLIQSVERMTIEAANSFLKTLEEPPPGTIILLTTNNLRDVLTTIVSRVRTITFGVMSVNYLSAKIRELYPDSDDDQIRKACLFSLGKTGKAVQLIRKPEALSEHIKAYHDIQGFVNHNNTVDRFAYVNEIIEDPKKIELFYNLLSQILRSRMLEEKSYEVQKKYIKTLSKIADAGMLSKGNVNLRLFLENLILSL